MRPELPASLALDRYAETRDQDGNTGHFFHEYPENVRLLGLSFNTALGTLGVGAAGRLRPASRRAASESGAEVLIEDGLAPMTTGLGLAGCESNPGGELCPRHPVTGDVLPSGVTSMIC